jgi:hypothetical protein
VKEIVDGVNAALGEELGAVGADAFDHAYFGCQGEGHPCVIYTIGHLLSISPSGQLSWRTPVPYPGRDSKRLRAAHPLARCEPTRHKMR